MPLRGQNTLRRQWIEQIEVRFLPDRDNFQSIDPAPSDHRRRTAPNSSIVALAYIRNSHTKESRLFVKLGLVDLGQDLSLHKWLFENQRVESFDQSPDMHSGKAHFPEYLKSPLDKRAYPYWKKDHQFVDSDHLHSNCRHTVDVPLLIACWTRLLKDSGLPYIVNR